MFKRAIDIKSSWLAALLPPPLTVVRGVMVPFTEPVVDVVPSPLLDAFFAASLFCFEAEGAIVVVERKKER